MTSCTRIVLFILCAVIIFSVAALSAPSNNAFAITKSAISEEQQQKPTIKASDIYQSRTIVLGDDIKNLIIMIPDEGHEQPNQSPKELRIINQPYTPQNAVVNVGTTVRWFNADVDHPHKISLTPNNTNSNISNNKSKAIAYESGIIKNFTASKPIKFNNTGTFSYSGPSFDKGVPSYKMNGTIRVVNQPLNTSFNSTTTNISLSSKSPAAVTTKNTDTITTLIVPANQLGKAISELKSRGFGIDNQYPFTSLRGGGSTAGGDKHQVLLILTSSGKGLNEVVSALNKITPTMPYR